MVRLCSAGVLLSLLLLLGGCNLTDGGDGIVELTGTVLSIEDSVVTLDVSDTCLALRTDTICFVLKDFLEEGDGAYGPVVGDEVSFIYAKPLEPGDPPVAHVKDWGLPEYRMEGTLLSLDEEYAVIEPLDEKLRQEFPEIRFSLDFLIQRGIANQGFLPGDKIYVSYVRDIQPGPPAEIMVKAWSRMYVEY